MRTFRSGHSALLRQGNLMRIEASAGSRVTCVRGMVWLTQEQDRLDHILCAGESFVCDRAGAVLVNAAANDAVLDYPDPARCTIVRTSSTGRSARSLAADIGRIKARIEPQALRALPGGVRREIVEREAQRMRRQVSWLVFHHLRRDAIDLPLRLFARVRGWLARTRRAAVSRLRQSGAD
jgi:hypothetical protein